MPPTERVISILIVCCLAIIAVAIAIKGRHYDPNRYALRIEALNGTASAVEGKAGTLRGETDGRAEDAEARHAAVPVSAEGHGGEAQTAVVPKGEAMEIKLPGLAPMGQTEFYSADTLFEKIDGRAPAYVGFNFQQLRSRSFSVIGLEGSFVDVFEFRMDTPINAFGIFALERDPKGRLLTYVSDGYAGELGYYFRQGSYYIQILASDQKPRTTELAAAVAENRAKSIPVDDAGLDGRRRLPNLGLIPESVTFIQDNAQGQAFMKNVFQASYNFDGANVPFFVMVATPEAAAEGWKSYRAFSSRFGKTSDVPGISGAQIFEAESFGTWKVIYQRQGELGGAYDAEDRAKARQFVEKYLQGEIQ